MTSDQIYTNFPKDIQPKEPQRAFEQNLLKDQQDVLLKKFRNYEEEKYRKNHHITGIRNDALDPIAFEKNLKIESKEQDIFMLQRKIELVKEENGRFQVKPGY